VRICCLNEEKDVSIMDLKYYKEYEEMQDGTTYGTP
jgi:hypothetical protein